MQQRYYVFYVGFQG